jgi:hypothetical protein
MICSVTNCGMEAKAKGLCSTHYVRKRYGLATQKFTSDNLRRAQITDEDSRQLERILHHLPERKP